jgi:hypothetical protein
MIIAVIMRDTALHGERTDIEVELRDVRTAEPADVVSSASPLNRQTAAWRALTSNFDVTIYRWR